MNIKFPVLYTDALEAEPIAATRKDEEVIAEVLGNKEKHITMENIINNNVNSGWAYSD